MTKRIVITAGEPAGIGPDICALIAQRAWPVELVVCADKQLLSERAAALGLPLQLRDYQPEQAPQPQAAASLTVLHQPLTQPCVAGQLDARNGQYVLDTLARANDGCMSGEFAAVVTAPVHKGVINDAGVPFSGHTEFFAERSHSEMVVMMLACPGLRVALVTTHLPLNQVSAAITPQLLQQIIRILDHDLRHKFAIAQPKIYVCGLNPHAGEGGHMGREEIDVIEPTLELLRQQGIELIGPLPADTLFQAKYLDKADAVLAMYHDQGLPVLKYKGFGNSVNITLGLPFIRTSVDHGTALDLAATGTADAGSMLAALQQAIDLVIHE